MEDIKSVLDNNLQKYNREEFIAFDPVQIPHRFSLKEDIEISAFLTATIAWGQRKSIINNALRLMALMDNSPYHFVMNEVPDYRLLPCDDIFSLSTTEKWQQFKGFCHRTFNAEDCLFFLLSLKRIYSELGGLEAVFTQGYQTDKTIFSAIKHFRQVFLMTPHAHRVEKHISNVEKKSAAKRINMFLRWMVRKDKFDIDFGIWHKIPTSALMLPLDVHSANVSRQLGLLTWHKNDWKAVEEVTDNLTTFDSKDPIKYDFALFGEGVFDGKSIQNN